MSSIIRLGHNKTTSALLLTTFNMNETPIKGTNWKELRSQVIHAQKLLDDVSTFCIHLMDIHRLIQKYNANQYQDILKKSCNDDVRELTLEEKSSIIELRHALRFLFTLLSSHHESYRRSVQEEAICVHKMHKTLSILISNRYSDSKCRTMAAKILCNCGTCNKKTSSIILNDIRASPTDSEKTFKMLHSLSLQQEEGGVSQQHGYSENIDSPASSWSEMIYSTSIAGDREALSAVAASLHNFIMATKNMDNDHKVKFDLSMLAADPILTCNLVRHILPKDVIKPKAEMDDDIDRDLSDDATMWISLVLENFSSHGFFACVYKSLGFNSRICSKDEQTPTIITAEQLVLLNCIAESVESYGNSSKDQNPLGSIGIDGEHGLTSTISFLAQLWVNLRKRKSKLTNPKDDSIERYDGEFACLISALNIILDILGTSISCDDDKQISHGSLSSIRMRLGKEISFLNDTVLELGILIDRLGIENRGLKSRELVISKNDQHSIVALVRVIGNLSYRCKENQDLLRNIDVPVPQHEKMDEIMLKKCTVSETSTESLRNGLHVVLSCTSFAYGCFTLREWAIVAIRNLLEGNDANQEEVARLEAQQAIDTPELQKLGVKVKLDKKGKVQVTPSDPHQNNISSK